MEGHDRQDVDFVALNAVENAVGESAGEATSDISAQHGPCRWVSDNVEDCGMNLQGEIIAQADFALLVVLDRVVKFGVRFRVK